MGVGPWNGWVIAAGVLPGCRRQFQGKGDRKIGDVRTVGVRHKGQQRQQSSTTMAGPRGDTCLRGN